MVSVHGVTISEIASFFSDILVIWATGSWSFSGPTPKSPVAQRATGSQNSVARRQNPVAMAPGHPLSFNAGHWYVEPVVCVVSDMWRASGMRGLVVCGGKWDAGSVVCCGQCYVGAMVWVI